MSLPSWERGLKRENGKQNKQAEQTSLPSWERGLKQ